MNERTKAVWTDYNPVRITAGKGAFGRLFDIIPEDVRKGRLFMVTSAGFTARGVTARIEAMGRDCCLPEPILVFDGVTANPELDMLDRIATGLRSERITGIIALGGGSVLDTAKAISVGLPDHLDEPLATVLRGGAAHEWEAGIPVYAIPTTAGTGAEVTPFATVWDSEKGKKYSVTGEKVYPVHALLDPELTVTLPEKETLYTGLDAISHALESLWNKNRTVISEALSVKALSLANQALPALMRQPEDLDMRAMMQQASLLAGLAISRTKTAIAHAISYPVTIRYGVPHGLACSFTLPGLIRRYMAYGIVQDPVLLEKTLETLECFDLKAEMSGYTKGADLSAYAGEMFHPERAGNYDGDLSTRDVERLLMGPEPA